MVQLLALKLIILTRVSTCVPTCGLKRITKHISPNSLATGHRCNKIHVHFVLQACFMEQSNGTMTLGCREPEVHMESLLVSYTLHRFKLLWCLCIAWCLRITYYMWRMLCAICMCYRVQIVCTKMFYFNILAYQLYCTIIGPQPVVFQKHTCVLTSIPLS